MSEKIKVQKYMQVITRNGVCYQFGVSGLKEYNVLKQKIKNSKKEFVEIIETCDIRRNDIVSYEYREQEIKDEQPVSEESKND